MAIILTTAIIIALFYRTLCSIRNEDERSICRNVFVELKGAQSRLNSLKSLA